MHTGPFITFDFGFIGQGCVSLYKTNLSGIPGLCFGKPYSQQVF
jgi:hypothetical protein